MDKLKPVMSMCINSKEYFKQLSEYYRVENERLKAEINKLETTNDKLNVQIVNIIASMRDTL